MPLFAISDVHLSFSSDKPMDIFKGWENYVSRLENNWNKVVSDDDIIVISGDISWAMKLKDVEADFSFLNNLKGQKIIIKGNHDLWWDTMSKMNSFISEKNFNTIRILHNNMYPYGKFGICGTRGWCVEEGSGDEKILNREAARLEKSITDALNENLEPIVFLHYPPVCVGTSCEVITSVLKKYNIKRCYYGHIHGSGAHRAFCGELEGIKYRLISCDTNDFTPILIET